MQLPQLTKPQHKLPIKYERFAKWLRQQMKQHKMPAAHLSIFAGGATTHDVNLWISGRCLPNVEQWDLIADFFAEIRSTDKDKSWVKASLLMEMSKTINCNWW